MYYLRKHIRKLRNNRNLTQDKISELLDFGRQHIAKVETAKRCSSLSLIFKTADALDVTEDKLFDFT